MNDWTTYEKTTEYDAHKMEITLEGISHSFSAHLLQALSPKRELLKRNDFPFTGLRLKPLMAWHKGKADFN